MISGKRKGISNWIRQFSTHIDPEKRVYMQQEGLFGIFKWGKFRSLPALDYVLVFRQFFAKCEACSFDENDADNTSLYQVSLVFNKNRRIIVLESKGREEAFGTAKQLAAAFRLRVLDSASKRRKSTWLS